MSSVLGLNARPHKAKVLPRRLPLKNALIRSNSLPLGRAYSLLSISYALVYMLAVCMDVVQNEVKLLQQAHVSIFEPGLAAMVENLESGRLRFTFDEKLAVEQGEALFMAVGTPSDEDGSTDLKYLLSVGGAR